jgi:hypothetical protein
MSERELRYSQPKLELFGLYQALQHWCLYIIGVKNLTVEVDAKYIQDLLNNLNLRPDTAVNRWIQGILMFHFVLIHVPATKIQGPDALSRCELVEREDISSDDDVWLHEIALYVGGLEQDTRKTNSWPMTLLSRKGQEQFLRDMLRFLTTLETPVFDKPQKHAHFIHPHHHERWGSRHPGLAPLCFRYQSCIHGQV